LEAAPTDNTGEGVVHPDASQLKVRDVGRRSLGKEHGVFVFHVGIALKPQLVERREAVLA